MPETSEVSFYSRLQTLKPTHIKTDAEFARFLGIGKDVIGYWKLQHEAGKTDFIPTYRLLEKIAHKLEISKGKLAFGE
jgi:hypothetical protein